MRPVGYVYDPVYLEHDVVGHPESSGRLLAIASHLESSGVLGRLEELPARDATEDDLALIHSRALIERVRAASGGGTQWLDPDTYVVPHSGDAALRSAGGVLAAADAGLDLAAFERRFGRRFEDVYAETLADTLEMGLLERDNGRLRLTDRGRYLANEVFVRLLPD